MRPRLVRGRRFEEVPEMVPEAPVSFFERKEFRTAFI
jgi:hypothetical protein